VAVVTFDSGLAGAPLELPTLRAARRAVRTEATGQEEFARFYAAEFPRLAGYCLGLTGSESVARDLAQEALVRLFSRWSAVSSPRAYAYLVATNLAKRTWRRRKGESEALRRLGLSPNPAPGSPSGDPGESQAWLRDLVEALPDHLRRAVLLHYFADLSVNEVARVLRVPAGTVKRRLHDARTLLRPEVGE
jgi:RNA polymerase sigma-70 factor, ECF subfamily